jgi:hypothetical protein
LINKVLPSAGEISGQGATEVRVDLGRLFGKICWDATWVSSEVRFPIEKPTPALGWPKVHPIAPISVKKEKVIHGSGTPHKDTYKCK